MQFKIIALLFYILFYQITNCIYCHFLEFCFWFPTCYLVLILLLWILIIFLQIKEHDLFFKAVSLCHTVQISSVQTDSIGDGPWQSNFAPAQLEYYASSPDEKALVEAAAR